MRAPSSRERYGLRLFVLFASPLVCSAQLPCLKEAWKAFEAKEYRAAISYADTCIVQFADQAKAEEASLAGQPVPTGAQSDQAKAVIFSRGVLNDTGAAYYIKGESARILAQQTPTASRIMQAKSAYQGCVELHHAVTFNPQGSFWSTADTCAKMVKILPAPRGAAKADQKRVSGAKK